MRLLLLLTTPTHLPVNTDSLVTESQRFVSEGAVVSSVAGGVVVEITVLVGQYLPLLHAAHSDHFTLKMLTVQYRHTVQSSDEISSCAVTQGGIGLDLNTAMTFYIILHYTPHSQTV